jgi:hypothetical protein
MLDVSAFAEASVFAVATTDKTADKRFSPIGVEDKFRLLSVICAAGGKRSNDY